MTTQFTEHPIETLPQWNAVLSAGCCCEMPECPLPFRQCQSISGTGSIAFEIQQFISGGYVWWRRWRTDYSDGGFVQRDVAPTHVTNLGGVVIEPSTRTITEGDPRTGTTTDDYSVPVTPEESRVDSIAAMVAGLDWDTMTKAEICYAFRDDRTPTGAIPAVVVNMVFHRFRWEVPDTFGGAYYKITWDEVFFPEDEEEDPVVVTSNKSWEWVGPGDPEDADTWFSDWYELDPPADPGEVRVVNVRYECQRGPYGSRPQLTGETYEPPPDP